MSRLLALVADLLASGRSLRTVARKVAILTTVVALTAIDALAGHVTVATTRVARLSGLSSSTVAATIEASASVVVRAECIGAVARNVADLTTLITLLGSALPPANGTSALGAVATDVTSLSTAIARLSFLLAVGAFAANVSFATAVITLGRAAVRAVTDLMARLTAREAGAGRTLEIHSDE